MQLGYDTFRTRFGGDIVAECRPAVGETNKVAILLPGCPGYPLGKYDISLKLSHAGFFVIIPAYRGTWESNGSFLEFPPDEDVRVIIDELSKGFRDLWSEADYRIHKPEVYLFGGSFGGAAAILASRHPAVVKAIAISSVVDWKAQEHTVQPPTFMNEYVPKAFGNAYRPSAEALKKLDRGDFYNPVHKKESIDGTKLLLIHAQHDRVVHAAPAQQFAADVGARYVELSGDAHMGIGGLRDPRIWKEVQTFLNLPRRRWLW